MGHSSPLRPKIDAGPHLLPLPEVRLSEDGRIAEVALRTELPDANPPYGISPIDSTISSVMYSYDGRAVSVEMLVPANLFQIPMAQEVKSALLRAGVSVEGADSQAPSGSSRPDHEAVDPLSQFETRGSILSMRFRPGEPTFVYDGVGDGTVTVSYSYWGLALELCISDPTLAVYSDTLPCEREVVTALRRLGIEVADRDDPAWTVRPWLSTAGRHPFIRYTFAGHPDWRRYRREYPGHGQPLSVMYARQGHPMWLSIADLDLTGDWAKTVPHRQRVESIISRQREVWRNPHGWSEGE